MTEDTETNTSENHYFAAIDLGSRNCRLLVAKKTVKNLENIEATSRFVCLAEQMTKTKKLSNTAMERALTTLATFQKKIARYKNVTTLAITTAATRNAENGSYFIKQVQQELGLNIHVISTGQEAIFATLGCAALVKKSYKKAIIFDIGGGSTEVIFADFTDHKSPRIIDSISIPLGVVSLAEASSNKTFQAYSQTVEKVLSHTQPFCEKHKIQDLIDQDLIQLIGTSGTITTVSALHQNLKFYNRDKVDGSTLTPDEIDKTIKHVQLMGQDERLLHPCIGHSRDDLILGGLAIFEGIYRAFPDLPVTVTDRGVRDGMVYALAYPERLKELSQ